MVEPPKVVRFVRFWCRFSASRGWHSGVVSGTLSAAASAGCLYGLDAARFDASQIYRGLGRTWETDRIPVKAYAAMGLLTATAAGRPNGPLASIGAQMNVMCTVAVALLDGAVLIDQFADSRSNAGDVWSRIDRTHTHHDQAYDALPAEDQLTTRVAVTLKDGRTREKTVAYPPGTGDRLLTNDDIVKKYCDLTRSVIDTQRESAIEKAVPNLEALDDIGALTDLLIPTVHPALG